MIRRQISLVTLCNPLAASRSRPRSLSFVEAKPLSASSLYSQCGVHSVFQRLLDS
jgi:hypothetical protein